MPIRYLQEADRGDRLDRRIVGVRSHRACTVGPARESCSRPRPFVSLIKTFDVWSALVEWLWRCLSLSLSIVGMARLTILIALVAVVLAVPASAQALCGADPTPTTFAEMIRDGSTHTGRHDRLFLGRVIRVR